MSCQICFEKYDHSDFKPYTLYPCSHTVCYQCITSLVEHKCPKCRCMIKDKKPNFGLLELIPDINIKINFYLNEFNEFKRVFNLNYDKKNTENQFQITRLKSQINEHADQLINLILSEQTHLIAECDKLDTMLNKQLNDLLNNEQQLEQSFKTILANLKKNQFSNDLNKDLEAKRVQFKHKLNQLESNTFEFEFKKNKLFTAQNEFGVIGQISKKKRNNSLENTLNEVTAETIVNKGNALRKILKNPSEANKLYDKAIQLDPTYHLAYFNKGISLKNLNNLPEAIDCFDRVIELNPNFINVYNTKGDILRQQQKYEEALKCYDKAIELNPNDATAFCNRGYTFNEAKQYVEAIQSYDRAIELNTHNPMTYNNKGFALKELNRLHEAIECFDKAIKLDSNFRVAEINKQNVLKLIYN